MTYSFSVVIQFSLTRKYKQKTIVIHEMLLTTFEMNRANTSVMKP